MDSPQRRIFTESDVYQWTHSKAYTRLIAFIQELNSAVVDRAIDIDNSDELTGLEVCPIICRSYILTEVRLSIILLHSSKN